MCKLGPIASVNTERMSEIELSLHNLAAREINLAFICSIRGIVSEQKSFLRNGDRQKKSTDLRFSGYIYEAANNRNKINEKSNYMHLLLCISVP